MIPVGRLAPLSQWDTTLIDALIDGKVYPHGLDVRRYDGYPNTNGCILVCPGRYWWNRVDLINIAIATYDWLLFIRTSDEEDLFDIHKVEHPRVKFWVQTPRTDRDYGDARLFGVGYTPHFQGLSADPPAKSLDVYLAAQNTHPRRQECFEMLQSRGTKRRIHETPGFTQGLDTAEYARLMVQAKVAPCPSGPESPDSFRVYEALEVGAIPICDDLTPGYDSAGYWRMLYPDAPFPILTDYTDLPGYISDQLFDWPANANRITAWWMREKRRMALNLVEDLEQLGAL
jgi:hypothetical protein